ncbi:YopX family protein [Bacillus sp. Marseille-P3800]|uniref:YopX family protein n=1 Tax=Bacillus sp. Marseille-P3800 TaxID=2014782 RepID=UPI000C07D49C|nr:YopX family protein [Bacillus sp. Marseille-P3800]
MREIMFRGYDPFDKQWHYGNYLKLGTGASYIVPQNLIANNIPQYRVDGNSVSQYTGLKDKNGTEIYEGDIVTYTEGEYSFKGIVEWDYWCWYIKGTEPIDSFTFEDIANRDKADCVVVGNIHQHPDLLNN